MSTKTNLFLGEVDDDIKFDYEPNTVIDASCASSLEGEMFILGGWNHARQVNSEKLTESSDLIKTFFKMKKIKDCTLKSVGQLPFDFYAGGCNTFPFGIMMCFPAGADQECHSWVQKSLFSFIRIIILDLMAIASNLNDHRSFLINGSLPWVLIASLHS